MAEMPITLHVSPVERIANLHTAASSRQAPAAIPLPLLLRRASASIDRQIDRRLNALGLTSAQWQPLLLLARGLASTGAGIASMLALDSGCVTRMLDRLEAKGYCTRGRSEADRRSVTIGLTDAGRRAISNAPVEVEEVMQSRLAGFSDDEKVTLAALLVRLIAGEADRWS